MDILNKRGDIKTDRRGEDIEIRYYEDNNNGPIKIIPQLNAVNYNNPTDRSHVHQYEDSLKATKLQFIFKNIEKNGGEGIKITVNDLTFGLVPTELKGDFSFGFSTNLLESSGNPLAGNLTVEDGDYPPFLPTEDEN